MALQVDVVCRARRQEKNAYLVNMLRLDKRRWVRGCKILSSLTLVDKWLLLLRKLFIVLPSVVSVVLWKTSTGSLLHHVLTSNWDVTVTGAEKLRTIYLRSETGQATSLKLIENFKSFLTRSQNFQKIKNCVFFPTLSFNRKIGRWLRKITWSLAYIQAK